MLRSVWCVYLLIGQCSVLTRMLYDYHYIPTAMNWTNAQAYCKENHTDLATVTNLSDMKRLNNSGWIGLYKSGATTRIWHWSQPWIEIGSYQIKWGEGDPVDKTDGQDNCAFMRCDMTVGDFPCKNKNASALCYDDKTKTVSLVSEKMDWSSAQKHCRDEYTDLVSGAEQLDKSKAIVNGSDYKDFLIGLFRDKWGWSDGSKSSFRHWYELGNGDCAFVKDKTMRSEICQRENPFFCLDDRVQLIKENKTWEDALEYCRLYHRDLLSITSLEEQRWAQEKAKTADSAHVWLGLRYGCALDLWFWVSDQLVRYDNWGQGAKREECDVSGAMETGGENKWASKQDHTLLNFLCVKH